MHAVTEDHQQLPIGVKHISLKRHEDSRGWLTELYRAEWDTGVAPVQWNVVYSNPRTLRGMHVHLRHWDYLTVPYGKMLLALKDLRTSSPTHDLITSVALGPNPFAACIIPPGVAHGFYFSEPSMHMYSVSEYWNLDDELGCRWNDPDLGVLWPDDNPLLSPRDQNAGGYRELLESIKEFPFPIQDS